MAFQENLKQARMAAGYVNAKEFAEKVLKMNYQTYNKYETQGAWPKEETLKRISRVLHVSVDSLLDLNNEEKESDYLEIAKSIAKMCGVKFHIPKEGFIQVDTIKRRKAPPDFPLPNNAFQTMVFKSCDLLKPELDTFRTKINEYKRDRFAEVFRHIILNYYLSVAKELAPHGRESRIFDSPYYGKKYDDILREFV